MPMRNIMLASLDDEALDPFAAVGEACGRFAIECSDVAGHVTNVAERIRANTGLLSSLRATSADLMSGQQDVAEATLDAQAFASQELGRASCRERGGRYG